MPAITKVLIANRSEIAVRIIRACRDYNVESVAIYADPDRDCQHVKLADEAYSLDGNRAQETYLSITKIIEIAKRSGADAVHPGYGFLAENADFASAVISSGLTWIGPSPKAINALGDKVSARAIAQRAGAPLVPGTENPVEDVSEVQDFAKEYGLPVAIKAAFGGGGRGLKVARTHEEIPELYDSAVREAIGAFGRGECFVERYLDKPRHVETQCLADAHGNVVVVSTRDCSLQRRHQKLLEEAPAPFLTPTQNAELVAASKAILKETDYQGAGTCEFLVGLDGTISFLEVNTRLQVEHPVTEEVTGIDLVIEQFKIAEGKPLDFQDPAPKAHSLEFRINGEDPAAGFLPSPGTITKLNFPTGPGVRVDSGVSQGDVISGNFDSMIAKIIITGKDRAQAIARAKRALAEFEIEGIPTVTPFHQEVLKAPAFVAEDGQFNVHTRWIETEFAEVCATLTSPGKQNGPTPESETTETQRVVVEVGGKRLEVVIPAGLGFNAGTKLARSKPSARRNETKTGAKPSGSDLVSPMQGTIVKVAVEDGQNVNEGDLIVVLEAMKMEQPLTAHRTGIISGLSAAVGAGISSGQTVCQILSAQ